MLIETFSLRDFHNFCFISIEDKVLVFKIGFDCRQ